MSKSKTSEPWSTYGEVGQTAVWLSADSRQAEREARRAERERAERLAERAEQREHMLAVAGMEWAAALGERFDPANPTQFIPTPEARAEMIEASETKHMWRQARKVLRDNNLPVDMLRNDGVPESQTNVVWPVPSAEEQAAQRADARLAAARRRSDQAARIAKIRRTLLRSRA